MKYQNAQSYSKGYIVTNKHDHTVRVYRDWHARSYSKSISWLTCMVVVVVNELLPNQQPAAHGTPAALSGVYVPPWFFSLSHAVEPSIVKSNIQQDYSQFQIDIGVVSVNIVLRQTIPSVLREWQTLSKHWTTHELTTGRGWHAWLYSESISWLTWLLYCCRCRQWTIFVNTNIQLSGINVTGGNATRGSSLPLTDSSRLVSSSHPSTHVSIMKTLSPNATWTILHDTQTLTNIKVTMQSWWSVIGGSLLALSSSLS